MTASRFKRTFSPVCPCAALLILLGAASSHPGVWRTKDIASSRALDLTRFECDAGMKVTAKSGALELLIESVPYSGVELSDRSDYHERDAVAIEIASIKSGSVM